jgi:ATP-dependent RNA helicase
LNDPTEKFLAGYKGRRVIALNRMQIKRPPFPIAILEKVDKLLHLSSTRELAVQIQMALGNFLVVHCQACICGTNLSEDIWKLDCEQHLSTAHPYRSFAMTKRRVLRKRSMERL